MVDLWQTYKLFKPSTTSSVTRTSENPFDFSFFMAATTAWGREHEADAGFIWWKGQLNTRSTSKPHLSLCKGTVEISPKMVTSFPCENPLVLEFPPLEHYLSCSLGICIFISDVSLDNWRHQCQSFSCQQNVSLEDRFSLTGFVLFCFFFEILLCEVQSLAVFTCFKLTAKSQHLPVFWFQFII